MSNAQDLFRTATHAASTVVEGAAGADLEAPSPCAEWTVRDLIDHWAATTAAMARIGRGEALDAGDPWGSDRAATSGDWRAELTANLTAGSWLVR